MPLRSVVRWLIERSLPSLVQALSAVQAQVAETPAPLGSLTGWLALAWGPADLDSPRTQLVAEGTRLGLVFEQGDGHEHNMPGEIATTLEAAG
jgi:hypothetical protein